MDIIFGSAVLLSICFLAVWHCWFSVCELRCAVNGNQSVNAQSELNMARTVYWMMVGITVFFGMHGVLFVFSGAG